MELPRKSVSVNEKLVKISNVSINSYITTRNIASLYMLFRYLEKLAIDISGPEEFSLTVIKIMDRKGQPASIPKE